ncbi:MAG: hypothetical protein WDL87_07690 [Candidatus Omnitrophota bacterium]|jgi:hypothetical protein
MRNVKGFTMLLGWIAVVYFPIICLLSMVGGAGGTPFNIIISIIILECSGIGLFITGIGIILLRKWAWWSTMVLAPVFTLSALYSLYEGIGLGQFLFFYSFPSLLFILLLFPEIEEQFVRE